MSAYRPWTRAAEVRCPALLVAGAGDRLCPPGRIKHAAALMARGELKVVDTTHFGMYLPGTFDDIVAAELAFLAKHL